MKRDLSVHQISGNIACSGRNEIGIQISLIAYAKEGKQFAVRQRAGIERRKNQIQEQQIYADIQRRCNDNRKIKFYKFPQFAVFCRERSKPPEPHS